MIIGTATLPALLALIKPTGDPLVNVAGAYFPAWLACLLAGVAGTWAISTLAQRTGFGRALRPAPLMIPCLFAAIACGMWLLVFSTR